MNMVTSVSSGRLYYGSLVAKPQSRLLGSLVAQTFNNVTDKKSSSILIYLAKGMGIYTEMNGVN